MDELILFLIPLLFSIHQILVRRGGEEIDTLSGTYLSLLTSTILFSPSLLFANVDPKFLTLMLAAGFFHFFVARLCFYHAIERIGANLSAPLSATRVYFAAILTYLIGEEVTPKIIFMSILIFLGVALLSRPKGVKIDAIGIFLGLATGFFSALSSLFVRMGMLESYNPYFGTFVGFAFSTLLLTPFVIKKNISMRGGRFFIIASIFVGFGQFIRYVGLYKFQVAVVEPIVSIYPLFTIVFSYMFLRSREIFGKEVVLGAFLVILGINIYFF